MQLTIDVPDSLARRLDGRHDRLNRILEAGLLADDADSSTGYQGLADVLKFLARLPSPAEILELRPSAEISAKLEELLEKNRGVGLSTEEERFWESYEFVEHIVRMAKKAALRKSEQ